MIFFEVVRVLDADGGDFVPPSYKLNLPRFLAAPRVMSVNTLLT